MAARFASSPNGTRHRPPSPRGARRLLLESLEARLALDGALTSAFGLAPEAEAAPMPDFALIDVNANSATYNQGISPRDYLEQVSGWYFGEAM
jgi:hypothetical protein